MHRLCQMLDMVNTAMLLLLPLPLPQLWLSLLLLLLVVVRRVGRCEAGHPVPKTHLNRAG